MKNSATENFQWKHLVPYVVIGSGFSLMLVSVVLCGIVTYYIQINPKEIFNLSKTQYLWGMVGNAIALAIVLVGVILKKKWG